MLLSVRTGYLLSAFFLALSSYFGYYLIYGNRGYHAWQVRKEQLKTLQHDYGQLSNQHTRLLNKVQLLRKDIDPDLLEQQLWFLLRYIDPDKQVILHDAS